MIDISKVNLEEKYIDSDYSTTTLYFTAPKEVFCKELYKEFPDAEMVNISIEFPTSYPEARYASVMFSPIKKGESYGWSDVELPYDEIEMLIAMTE